MQVKLHDVFTRPSKKGGDLMYVELGSHVYSLSDGATREFQRSFTFCQEQWKVNNNEAQSAGTFIFMCCRLNHLSVFDVHSTSILS